MEEKFDRMIFVLSEELGLYISAAFASELLKSWLANEGWRFYDITYFNLPFSLLWAEQASPLFGRKIQKGGDLHNALLTNGKNVDFEDISDSYVKVTAKDNRFLDASFVIGNHQFRVIDEHLYETITLYATENNERILKKEIEINNNYIQDTLTRKDWKEDTRLLSIAKKLMG